VAAIAAPVQLVEVLALERFVAEEGFTLYGDHRSGNCYKAALILKLTGREFRWVEIDVLKAETRNPDFLEMNPNGKVPLLRLPNGSYLSESNAMLIYLASRTPYFPLDWYRRALVLQWLFFEQYSHEPYIAVSRFLLHFNHGMEVEPGRIRTLHERGRQALDVMEKVLSQQQFIAGEEYTVADIALYAYTHVAEDGGFDTSRWPGITAWLERVAGLPGHFDLKDLPV
jgi:glutathione S-transferase